MSEVKDKLDTAVAFIREKTNFVPKIAMVLGSGLGDFAEKIEIELEIPYAAIPGFPVSTVSGHSGRFIFGNVNGVPVICMKGRVHYYEGYDITDVVLPTRVMGRLGAKFLILTNAAGGIQDGMEPGDLMMITDHISSFVPSPLKGENLEYGERFPDMSHVYDEELQRIITKSADETLYENAALALENDDNGSNIFSPLKKGVYCQLPGPNYETPAEIRMIKQLGADAVGMSTAIEAIAAHHLNMRVCGISCITNKAAGLQDKPLSHEEVKATSLKTEKHFTTLMMRIIEKISAL